MRKGVMICCTVLILFSSYGSLVAAAVPENSNAKNLWKQADAIADASSTYLPGVRRILYQEVDGKGNVVYSDQAVVLLESSHNGRYLQIREYGNSEIFTLLNRINDGFVMTPFEDNVEELKYESTGVTEVIDGKTCHEFTFEMAYDSNLPFYDPNYQESGIIFNWDSDDKAFDGNVIGSIWIDEVSGAPLKMAVNYLFEDNSQQGTLKVSQVVYFDYSNNVLLPNTVRTNGTLKIDAGQKGFVSVKDFVIEEEQLSFWQNTKFARGSIVY